MKRTALVFACVGLILPVAWLVLYHQSERFSRWWFAAPDWVDVVRLVLWPGALLLAADPMDTNFHLWVVSAIANGVLYAALGALIGCAFVHRRAP